MILAHKGFDGLQLDVDTNTGTVTIDSAGATSIAGSVAFSYTSSSDGQHYALSGTFEVTRCPM